MFPSSKYPGLDVLLRDTGRQKILSHFMDRGQLSLVQACQMLDWMEKEELEEWANQLCDEDDVEYVLRA